ncbi:MAG: Asp-tRNA(Asn)/Glu-tRNA(Gln) amidotransferase subunit GatA [bacterium]|nr:Asp-tRNA(Asn)/Glu-tRNA(Gln) amidotransferase subunit GatA [bacterium]
MDLKTLTIKKAHEHLAQGDFSAMELSEAYLKNIEAHNKNINAYLEVFNDIEEQAKESQKIIESKKGGIFTGIPIAVKDNILIKGKRASSASKILEGYTATYDATVIKKLKADGAVFLGRTNMDEFAMGGSTENSAFGATKNPLDISRVPGGSSGGSAAAVAMDGALVALGSDTGGSIRQPASFCGLVGLKPTYGAVSRYGLMAMASSLDQIGPFGKTVEDAEILFNVIGGHDPMDSTSSPREARNNTDITQNDPGKKITIGIPKDIVDSPGIDSAVLKNFNETITKLKNVGYLIKEITLPHMHYALSVYYIIMPAEASTNLARFDGVRYGLSQKGATPFEDYAKTRGEGFGREVRRRILLGTYVLSSGYYDAYYNKAWSLRSLMGKDFEQAFKDVDVIATPTTPTPAFKIGEKSNDPLAMYLADVFTVPANLIGIPALSVPSGYDDRDGKKLPLGLQLMAPHFEEALLFKIGKDVFGSSAS